MQWYILDDNNVPHPVSDTAYHNWKRGTKDWGERKRVGRTDLTNCWVSTVFLGLDHRWRDSDPPELFETMVFAGDGWDEQYCTRCATWDEAVAMHEKGVAWALENIEDVSPNFDIYE